MFDQPRESLSGSTVIVRLRLHETCQGERLLEMPIADSRASLGRYGLSKTFQSFRGHPRLRLRERHRACASGVPSFVGHVSLRGRLADASEEARCPLNGLCLSLRTNLRVTTTGHIEGMTSTATGGCNPDTVPSLKTCSTPHRRPQKTAPEFRPSYNTTRSKLRAATGKADI